MHASASPGEWHRLEDELSAGAMTLRDVLAYQASLVRMSLEEAEATIARHARIEPTFAPFVRACEAHGAQIRILSGGVATLIGRALAREGLHHVEYHANDAHIHPQGWRMTFRDETEFGHDKRVAVDRAREAGWRTVFVGDGVSDFEAALASDVRFAKRGRALERYLREREAAFEPFDDFDDVRAVLFPD